MTEDNNVLRLKFSDDQNSFQCQVETPDGEILKSAENDLGIKELELEYRLMRLHDDRIAKVNDEIDITEWRIEKTSHPNEIEKLERQYLLLIERYERELDRFERFTNRKPELSLEGVRYEEIYYVLDAHYVTIAEVIDKIGSPPSVLHFHKTPYWTESEFEILLSEFKTMAE